MSKSSNQSSKGKQDRFERQRCRFLPLALADMMLIEPPRIGDARGWFSEIYSKRTFAENGVDLEFVQDNISFSTAVGTARGLHYQSGPFAQHKLVLVLHGRILDVAVDIRKQSPTFGEHVGTDLSAENRRALLVPAGFAHGFVTREPDTIVMYKVTQFYAPDHDHGIFWADPELGIDWGIGEADAILSTKDLALPRLAEADHLSTQ